MLLLLLGAGLVLLASASPVRALSRASLVERTPGEPSSALALARDAASLEALASVDRELAFDVGEEFDARAQARLRAEIARVLEEEGVPGVGVALVDRDGLRWTAGVGLADVASRRPVTPDTLFRVGSITKSFIALAIMQQVEAGRLSLDDELRALAPELAFDNRWSREAPITVAHLLEHTTGWDDMRFNESLGGPEAEALTLAEVLAINPRSRASRWRPGTRVSYSNPNYTAAAHVLERVTGERYEDTLRRDLLTPLGMEHADFRRTPEVAARLASGYTGPGEATPYWHIVHRPAGNLIASPRELAGLVHMWIQRGRAGAGPLISPESAARMERGETIPGVKSDVDYGLGNYGSVFRPIVTRGHDGGVPGYISSYGYSVRHGVGYVMLFNSSYSSRAYLRVRALLLAALLEGRRLPPPPIEPAPRERLARHVGSYRFVSPRMQLLGFLERAVLDLDVRLDETDQLTLAIAGGEPIPLIPTGEDTFRVAGQPGASVVLTTSAAGRRTANLGLGANFEASPSVVAKGARWLLILGWMMILMAIYAALPWVIKLLVGEEETRRRGYIPTRVAPLLAALAIVALIRVFIAGASRWALGEPTVYAVGVTLLSLAFAGLSGAALAHSIRALRYRLSWYTRAHSLLVSVACFGMTIWLLFHSIIGLRTWAW
ncbi:MAG: beta-lactamase family protein [Myxococcales bacterium]|nr:beta-lactamase family protein [Myxococcales bacterium]MCB9754136.1 beta-lactamase family protein [Myxococcales bacterium]